MHAGDRIGDWVVERPLGAGGMGEVYRAHRHDDPRVVAALKRIRGEVTPELSKRFLREAAILADLDHAGVPELLDYQSQPMFLAMELVQGEALSQIIRRGPLSVPDALEIARQLVDALAYVHGRGVWHRDLKPGNVVLQRDGWAKLVDFGVAAGEGYADLTATGMVVGTLPYVPPEALRGQEGEPLAWDLYAVGVILAKCLTGRHGFEVEARGQSEQVRLKLERPWVDPGPTLPDDVRKLVQDLTRADPTLRITSAGEAGRRIRAALREHPGADLRALGREGELSQATTAIRDRPGRPGRRERSWLWPAVVAVLVVMALTSAGAALVAIVVFATLVRLGG